MAPKGQIQAALRKKVYKYKPVCHLTLSPGGGNGKPLQYSCLENSMDRGAWWAAVHGAAKSQTWLSNWVHERACARTHTHTHTHTHTLEKKVCSPHWTLIFGTSEAASPAEATHFRSHETTFSSCFLCVKSSWNNTLALPADDVCFELISCVCVCVCVCVRARAL